MTASRRLVLASANPGKVAELEDLLGDRFEVSARPDDLPETVEDGATLEANAAKKAIEVARHTGRDALADDTGLFVTALGGAPGVRTARYAGEGADSDRNVTKLLGELSQATDRSAEFRTIIAFAPGGGGEGVLIAGSVAGTIAVERRGERGFGYDPIFVPDEGDGRSFAEMSIEEKHALSHRARALRSFLQHMGWA